jgi:hypothetical protein
MPGTTTTGLMPIDPAVSPQQIARVLPIRANLLPPEITAHRNARRIRIGLIGAVVIVVALVVTWYLQAVGAKADADDNLATVNAQVLQAQNRKKSHQDLTDTVAQREAITGQLSALQATDLPWSSLLDRVRAAGATLDITISSITGNLSSDKTASIAVGSVSITGSAKDKKTIANYVDALALLSGTTNPYLTSASKGEDGRLQFTVTTAITSEAFCGRFTTACKTGGN